MNKTRDCKGNNQMNKALGKTNYDWLVSDDSGNGLTKGFSVKGDGTCLSENAFLSTRAAISPEQFDGLASMGIQTDVWKWQGQTYALGEDVTQYPHAQIEGNMGIGRYGNDPHQFFIAASILNMGITEGDIDLTLYLPPSRFNHDKDTLKAAFIGKRVQIEVITANGIEYSGDFTYKNVRVLPEGVGAIFCNIYDRTGALDSSLADYILGQTAVIDIGNYTTDALRVLDGKFDPTQVSRATHQDFGVASMIKDPMLEEIRRDNPDVTPAQIDLAIISGNYGIKPGSGKPFGVKPMFERYAKQLANKVATEIIQRDFKNFEGMNGCFVIGGGGKIARPYLSQMYRGKIFSLDAMGHIDETDVNALGGLRFVMNNYFHRQN